MIRVLQIKNDLGAGGSERQLMELLTFFSGRKEIETSLLLMSNKIHYTDIYSLPVPIYFIVRRVKKDIRPFVQFYFLLKKIRPDIIHSWDAMCTIYAMPAAKLLGIKFINGYLRSAPPDMSIGSPEYMPAQLTFPFSDIILSNSQAGLDSYGVKLKKGICIYNGFNFDRISDMTPPEEVKKKFKIKTPYVVGMVARFYHHKDYATFLKAAKKLVQERQDVTFLCVGDGPTLSESKKMINLTEAENIRFLGVQKNVESIINIFDIGVLSTNDLLHGEGISNAIMEYMALETPVIATENSGGNNEIVKDNITGYLIKPRSSDALYQGIINMLSNPELMSRMGKTGKKLLLEKFSIGKMGENFLNLYNNLYFDVLEK